MRQRERQSGFSIVEAVLIVAVVGVIGAAGWFVYQHNRVKVTSAAQGTTQTTTTQPTQTTTGQNVVKIPELGIQIIVPDSIKDLTYKTETVTLRNGNQAILARFSTASLTAANPSCGPSSSVLGTLEKASGQYPTEKEDETNVLDYGTLIKQFPTFYISGSIAHAGICPTGSTTPAASSSDAHDFSGAFTSIQPLN
jgi:cytoskeletal protein RodZ